MSLGSRLRRLRIAKGLTQQQLADPHYTHAYISTIEAGRRQPSREALAHFAAKLGIGIEELETGRPASLEAELALGLQEARVRLSAGDYDYALEQYERIGRTAHRYELIQLQAGARQGTALVAERQGRPEEAVTLNDEALALLESEPPPLRAEATAAKARCVASLGDNRYAVHIMETLIAQMERTGTAEPTALVRLYAALVHPYFELGLFAKAAEAGEQATRFAARVSDPATLAMMEVNVARVLLHDGRPDDAGRALLRAQDLFGQLDLKTELSRARLATGYVLSRTGDLEGARAELTAAVETFEATGSVVDQAYTLTELARLERLQEHEPEAAEIARRSLALLQGEKDVAAWARASRELALATSRKDPVFAEKTLRGAIEDFARAEEPLEAAVTHRYLGDLLAQQGQSTAACEAYRAGLLVLDEPV
jgi:transcriptional regulator with XRE-family HTH domain/predicted negative regulator of RcsB-dependent stress response